MPADTFTAVNSNIVKMMIEMTDTNRNGLLRPAFSLHLSDIVPITGSLMASYITPIKTMVPARASLIPAIFIRKNIRNAPTNSVIGSFRSYFS